MDFTLATIIHKSEEGYESFVDKLNYGLYTLKYLGITPNIIIGPDYSLSIKEAISCSWRPNFDSERQKILADLKKISKEYHQTKLLPGTMFWHEKRKTGVDFAHLSAPVYSNGKIIKECFKERDAGESASAELFGHYIGRGMAFHRGDCSNNNLRIDGKNVAVEICADHGHQNVRGCDLEIIMSFDVKAGIYLSSFNDNWSRHIVLCDGYYGKCDVQHFNANSRTTNHVMPKEFSRTEKKLLDGVGMKNIIEVYEVKSQ